MSTSVRPGEQSNIDSNEYIALEQTEVTSQAPTWRATLVQLWSLVVLPFLAIRLLLLLVGVVTIYYIVPLINRQQPIHLDDRNMRFPAMLVFMWDRFDSGFYLDIAHNGYWGANTLHGMSNWAFFPLYPLLVHIFAAPFSSNYNAYVVTGVVIANIAAVVAAIYLYKLTLHEFHQQGIAARAVLYLALFPLSYYLSAAYPESLFLALSLGCVYYARLHRWWLAGALGGLAALTRPQGVLLAVVVGWEYWQFLADSCAPLDAGRQGRVAIIQTWIHSRMLGLWRSLRAWQTWPGFVALLLIPLGTGLFCLYGKWKVGTFFPFQMTERYGWGRSFTNPFSFLIKTLLNPQPPNPYDWNFYALNMLVILIFLLLLIPLFRKLPAIYGIFALIFILMPLTTGAANSIPRYYMEIFPVFMLLGWWTNQQRAELQARRHNLITTLFAILLSLFTVMLTLGVYSLS